MHKVRYGNPINAGATKCPRPIRNTVPPRNENNILLKSLRLFLDIIRAPKRIILLLSHIFCSRDTDLLMFSQQAVRFKNVRIPIFLQLFHKES